MKILELGVGASDLAALEVFYGGVLGLKLSRETSKLIIQIGYTTLIFTQLKGFSGRYHFAFDIPHNQLTQARVWLEERTPLQSSQDGENVFHAEEWNADMIYFLDPAGNILELIARHNSETALSGEFSSSSFVSVSEIGLPTPQVPALGNWLLETLKLEPYYDYGPEFMPIGNESGLFIVVAQGREWFPDTGVNALPLPVEVTLEGETVGRFQVPDLPYLFQVVLEI